MKRLTDTLIVALCVIACAVAFVAIGYSLGGFTRG